MQLDKKEKERRQKEFQVIKQLLYSSYGVHDIPPWHAGENDLFLYKINIKSLPEDLFVPGDLIIENCPDFEILPSGLFVVGDVKIDDCPKFSKLPRRFKICGSLCIYRCSVPALPLKLSNVGGFISGDFQPKRKNYKR